MTFQSNALAVITLSVLAGCQSIDFADVPAEYTVSPNSEQITDVPEDFGPLEEAGFTTFTSVFGIPVVATSGVSESTILHVRSVLADYLDNDADGVADNPRVVFALQESNAVAAVFDTFAEYEGFGDRDGYDVARPYELITMRQEETNTPYGFDASLEEVLHLVTQWGFSPAFPDQLGESGDTGLVRALEEAQDTGDYFYDEPSCDARCQATEYFYWAITSNMGLQEQRCEEISQEWALCDPERLVERNPAFIELLESTEFQLPTVSPDGRYEPSGA